MKKLSAFAVIMIALLIIGCGDDDSTDPGDGILVLLSPGTDELVSVGYGDSLQFTAGVYNTTNTAVKWYVYGIENGNLDSIGSIDSTGLYIAPDTIISVTGAITDSVIITIVSQADTTKSASSVITIVDPVNIYVDDGSNASNETGKGTPSRPYRTITKALSMASLGQTVRVYPGTYDDTGDSLESEIYPISPGFGVFVRSVFSDNHAIVRAPAGQDVDNAAFLIRYQQTDSAETTIGDITIVGTSSSGVGINLAGESETTCLQFGDVNIDNCYIGVVKSKSFQSLVCRNNVISHCVYGLRVEYEGTALSGEEVIIKDSTQFISCTTAVDINSTIYQLEIRNSIIDTAKIGIDLGGTNSELIFFRDNQILNIDSIGVNLDAIAWNADMGDTTDFGPGFSYGNNIFSLSNDNGYFIYNQIADHIITAGGNDWYAPDSQYIDVHIWDFYDDNTVSEVKYFPFDLLE